MSGLNYCLLTYNVVYKIEHGMDLYLLWYFSILYYDILNIIHVLIFVEGKFICSLSLFVIIVLLFHWLIIQVQNVSSLGNS
jgi:hypothetical protein